jgi:hypothetical protein
MTTLKYNWHVASDESYASCSPDGNTAFEVVFEAPGDYAVHIDDKRRAKAVSLLDGMICAEKLYDYEVEEELKMAKKNENSLDNFATALFLATRTLRASIPAIDDLNGRLEELEHYMEHREKLSDGARDTLQVAYEFYVALPVWDTIETLADRLKDVREEVGELILEEVKADAREDGRKDTK